MSRISKAKKQELKPEVQEGKSGYKVKDKHFDRYKTFIDKAKGVQEEVEADWRRISVNRVQMVVHKGVELTDEQYKAFAGDKEAIKYWLEKS